MITKHVGNWEHWSDAFYLKNVNCVNKSFKLLSLLISTIKLGPNLLVSLFQYFQEKLNTGKNYTSIATMHKFLTSYRSCKFWCGKKYKSFTSLPSDNMKNIFKN